MIDAIDELIDETANGSYDGPMDRCARCCGEWHGLPTVFCTGPFAEGEADEPVPYVDQVVEVTLRHAQEQARAQIAQYAAATATPQQMMPYPDNGSDIVGGPCVLSHVPVFGMVTDEFEDTCWNRVFMLPESEVGQQLTPLIDPLYQELLHVVVEMIGEVCGIFLPDNSIQRVLETVREMTQARREERQRRDRIRCHLLNHDTAPPEGYTAVDLQALRMDIARHANDRREAVQGLQSGGDNESSSTGNAGQWETSAWSEVRDPLPIVQEAQQDSSARAESREDL